MIRSLLDREPSEPWSHGGKIPWDDPAFSERMLHQHLSQEHDRASRRASLVDEHVSWIHRRVFGSEAARVLDLGCGPGLYTSRLAALGHSCLGIDFSPRSIEHARAVAARDGLSCEYALGDLTSVVFAGAWDAALFLFGELNAFPRAVAADLLSRTRQALAPGGRVVLEVHGEAFVRSIGAQPPTWVVHTESVFSTEPHLVLRECTWHAPESASVERYFVLSEASPPEIFASTTQAYSTAEYAELLGEAGLVQVDQYPCLTGREVPADPGLYVIVAASA